MIPLRTRKIIDESGATAVLDAAERYALERGHRVVMAVVDPWGELVAFRRTPDAQVASSRVVHRPDSAQVASVEVTTDKARTAAIYRRPSKDFEDQASSGRPRPSTSPAPCRFRAASRSRSTAR
jgi:glc operon protein GlcG